MNNSITPAHYQITTMQNEIENWENQIDFIEKECAFYLKLISLPEMQFDKTPVLKQALQKISEANSELANRLLQNKNSLEGMIECDDLQCETYYLDQHKETQDKIAQHEKAYREAKSSILKEEERLLGVKNS